MVQLRADMAKHGQHGANSGANTTRSTRKPVQQGTTRQVATRHAAFQHDTDRHGPPHTYIYIKNKYIYIYIYHESSRHKHES